MYRYLVVTLLSSSLAVITGCGGSGSPELTDAKRKEFEAAQQAVQNEEMQQQQQEQPK